MNGNFKTRILGICVAFLGIFGTLILREYMANHTYYYDMLSTSTNFYVIIATLVSAAIPLGYMLYKKNASLKGVTRATWIGLVVYGILYASIREDILGSGMIMWVVNSALVFWLSVFILCGLAALGTYIYKRLYQNAEWSWKSIILSFGIGFGLFTIFNYVLILLNVYYPIVNWLQLVALGVLVRYQRNTLREIGTHINLSIRSLYTKNRTGYEWILVVLLLFSISYYFIGFQLAYIPYPTARDANHAYMLIPNAISGVNGWNAVKAGYLPVYLSFVSFFFSIIKGLGGKFWIAPDTFGVQFNYLTAMFTFITTLGIIGKTIQLVKRKDDTDQQEKLSMSLGWFVKLLWLTSGMGAFLVFIDNKSDFGIMYLSCLGLFAGLGYIDYLVKKYNSDSQDDIEVKEGRNDLYLSGFFFALAVASKVTALFDAMNFIFLLVGFVLGGFVLVGVALIVMGALAYLGLNGVSNFISKPFANIGGFGVGALLSLIGLGKGHRNQSPTYWPKFVQIVKHIWGWLVVFVATLVLLKGPVGIVRLINDKTTPQSLPKEMIFGKHYKPVLLASNTSPQMLGLSGDQEVTTTAATTTSDNKELTFGQCTLQAAGFTDSKDLYNNLLTPPGDGYTEDVGRYVGFGQKEFNNPWRGFLVGNKSCISINASAKIFCQNQGLISPLSLASAQQLLAKLSEGSEGYELVSSIVSWFTASDKLVTYTTDSEKLLTDYRHDKTITKVAGKVLVPYKLVVPMNVTFNWSLQNLSSYYTDIGIIWLMIQFFIVVAVVYGLVTRKRVLRVTNLVALIGWLLWIVIGGGIVWYGIGLITWSIIGFVLFVHELYIPNSKKEENPTHHLLFNIFIGLFMIFWLIQLSLNLVRIASQGGGGPFLQYKYSNGQALNVDENLQQTIKTKFPYKWQDILGLQFPHYNKVVAAVNAQTGDQVNIIAGTYAQYWVVDQTKLMGDGFLEGLWKDFSDWNTCNSYLRLQDKKIKYMIIDPNIASIVMGGGNSSLMEKFFAKIDPTNGQIVTDGTLSMLSKMTNDGYLDIYSTNNLGAKYGYGLPSEYLKSVFGVVNDDDLVLLRARLATARFWQNQTQIINGLSQIFTDRILDGKALGDVSDVFGKVIDEPKLSAMVNKAIQSGFPSIAGEIKDLTQDERFVLLNYLNILTTYNKQPDQFASTATSIINQSLSAGSQFIVFEVK